MKEILYFYTKNLTDKNICSHCGHRPDSIFPFCSGLCPRNFSTCSFHEL